MKKMIFASAIALSLFSCRENKPGNAVEDNAVDNAESSVSASFKSYRGNDTTVDNIYFELIKNDKKLTDLNTKIVKTFEETGKALAQYKSVLNTSASFYQDAAQQTKQIQDTLIRQQIEQEILASSEQYNLKVKNITDRINQITKNNETLTNLYTAFKIRKTLPEIEKYQNAHPLKTDSLDSFISRQNKLLEELKNVK
ncbi:hypothetical protein CRN76_08195 [Chryseobacterium indologenes]|uniref:hypothetical protein n=1 Tax=Chryseobacterium indologenes TaxID=253 RepID=UPI000BFD7E5B|nr:hypothetical protein [Chryseobacterium indologenes]ATN05384.1 hypothetical protein CRN76_08195 [Chryseobacterium indologenes]AYY85856.1 hypothetical protein EGX91_15540 [Chryseobacterium indologenes]QIX82756.1 hypothetical protein FOB56_16595 [Chryseobacterium indologenes]TLX26835.1 hypothetical protein FE904_04055 [Chryseobacterium indologenes]UDQ52416.1 hypothetical protein LJF28_13365 [Chryseobacterium indologenes]